MLIAVIVSAACSDGNGIRGVKHVVLIGLDGYAGNTVGAADMPVMKRMMDEGAWTLAARSILPSSSACNWATMFMGAGPEMHGYNTWGSSKPDFDPVGVSHYGMFPSIVGVLRDHDPDMDICVMYEWETIGSLYESAAADVNRHVPTDESRGERLTAEFTACLKERKPDFSMVIYDSPDHDGHAAGWGSEKYMSTLAVMDGYIARIVEAAREAGMYDDTVFIIVSDHGGIGKGHGGTTMAEMESPLVLFGRGVRRGHEIASAVMRYDTAPTIAYIFGAPCPDLWRGKPIREAFE